MGLFSELVKLYSYRSALRSNIISSTGMHPASNSNTKGLGRSNSTLNLNGNRMLYTWYTKMEEIKDYEVTELSNTNVNILKDYIMNYFNKESDIVTYKNNSDKDIKLKEDKMNSLIRTLGIVSEMRTHMDEILYYGSYSFKTSWDKESRVWKKSDLYNPYNVVTIYKGGIKHSNIIMTKGGGLMETPPRALVRLGLADLYLINDINEDFLDEKVSEDGIVKSYSMVAGRPLYYNIIGKVKDYLLKDQVVSILSIKDLIQPLLLLIRVDKTTAPDEANKLALNTENLINKYSDLSAIFGSNFSINDLMDSIINNIRVLPDYASSLGDMNSIDLTKITNKIQEIRSEQDSAKDAIHTSLGIPRSLVAGDVTKWEAIKSSQRLNSKLTSIIKSLSDSVKMVVIDFHYLLFNEVISPEDLDVNLYLALYSIVNSIIGFE